MIIIKQIINWFKENKYSILLLIGLCIPLFIIDYINNYHNSYLQWIITNIIWAIIILLMLDVFIKEKDNKKEINQIKEKIKNYDLLLDKYIDKYYLYLKMITDLWIEYWKEFKNEDLLTNIKFSDFKNLFKMPSLIIYDQRYKKAIYYYFENKNKLSEIIENMIIHINFKDYKEFIEIKESLLDYLWNINWIRIEDLILEDVSNFDNQWLPKNKTYDLLFRMFEESWNEPKEERNYSNIMTPYVILYLQSKKILKFIITYRKLIKKL